jgi:hypothetical protein
LIQDNKAVLLESASDFVKAMGWDSDLKSVKPETVQRNLFPDLSAEELRIVDILGKLGDLQINALMVQADIPINKINRVSRQLLQEMGREPTPEELGERLEMDEVKVRKVLKIAKEPISMETPIGDDEDSHLGDFIEDSNITSPVDAATSEGLKEATREVLENLTEREAKVLKMRFGNFAKLKPVISIPEGTLIVKGKFIGRKKAIAGLVSYIEGMDLDERFPIYGIYSDGTENLDNFVKKVEEKGIKFKECYQIGPTIGTHVGPENIGFIAVEKAKN